MGNSTLTLQSVADSASTIGDLNVALTDVGGWAAEPALTIANAAMADLVSERFNWKWNRVKMPPFTLNGNQQDYPTVSTPQPGWLESALVQDVNSTSFPKPTRVVTVVRDIPVSSWTTGWAGRVAFLPNALLELGLWPGPTTVYVNPIGFLGQIPNPPPLAINDPHGNILLLTTFGTTGNTGPDAGAAALPGAVVTDGTAAWTVCDPGAAGFRISAPLAPGGTSWAVLRVWAQAASKRFVSLADTLDPIPDSYSKWFVDGFIAYAHRHSTNPAVKARYQAARAEWMQAMERAVLEGNREEESYGFYPGRTVMDGRVNYGPTVGDPTNMRNGGGW